MLVSTTIPAAAQDGLASRSIRMSVGSALTRASDLSRNRLVRICAVVAVASAVGIWLVLRLIPPSAITDPQAEAILPVIDGYVDQHAGTLLNGWGYLDPPLKSRVLCEASVLEISPEGDRWRVGLQLNCGEFARQGHKLVEGSSGYPAIADLATLTKIAGRYHMDSAEIGPPSWDKSWADQNFSSRVAAWILGTDPPTAPDPISQAWKAFGFRPGTPAVEGN